MRTERVQRTFAMARHAMVDLTQVFVSHASRCKRDRLPPRRLQRVCDHLDGTAADVVDREEFEARLSALRLQYEPYAEALADYLLLELPPWIHPTARKDNWQSGPWDREIGTPRASVLWDEDHF